MRILIYGRFSSHHFAIRNVITNICQGVNDRIDLSKDEIFLVSNTKNLDTFKEMKHFTIIPVDIDPDDAMKNQFFTLFKLPRLLRKNKIDLVIFPQITFFFFKKCKTVFYIHDLIEYSVKNAKSISLKLRKFFYKRAAKISDRIITISENSKKDIIEILKYPESKISILYCGRDESLVPQDKDESLKIIKAELPVLKNIESFLLYVGYLAHPQKNLLFVLDNISEILKKYKLHFVLVGPDGKDAELIHEKIKEVNSKLGEELIISTGPINKNLLPKLYSTTKGFIFVSQYEGFGMPVLEAMSCGAPVITSNSSSLKEVSCGCTELIDPYNSSEFKLKLEKLINDGEKSVTDYVVPLEKFTWKNHIDGLIKLIITFGQK